MPKYLAKSADVLNAADDFEKRLAWQLFALEQDAQLFGYNPEVSWRPGDPIYMSYKAARYLRERGLASPDFRTGVARDMIEEFDNSLEFEDFVRCASCQVSWFGPEHLCWYCGEEQTTKPLIFMTDEEFVEIFETGSSMEWYHVDEDEVEAHVIGYFKMQDAIAELANRIGIQGITAHHVHIIIDECEG